MSEHTPDSLPTVPPTIRVTTMPADSNPYGDIFGGWLMAQMDMAAGLVAARHSAGRAVTIAVGGMPFHRPVFIRGEVSGFAPPGRGGNTSLTLEVETWRRARHSEETDNATQAPLVFVAVDENRRPRKVPPMAPPMERAT